MSSSSASAPPAAGAAATQRDPGSPGSDLNDRVSVFNDPTANATKKLWEMARQPGALFAHQYDCLLGLAKHFGESDEVGAPDTSSASGGDEGPRDARAVLIQLPTGAGKSLIAALAPYILRSKQALMITPSLVISEQLVEACFDVPDAWFYRIVAQPGSRYEADTEAKKRNFARKYLPMEPEVPRGLDGDRLRAFLRRDLIITNAQRFQSHTKATPELFNETDIDLVIVDEAHHTPAPTWRNILSQFREKPNCRIIYLTATPSYKGDRILRPADGVRMLFSLTRTQAVQRGIIRDLGFDDGTDPDSLSPATEVSNNIDTAYETIVKRVRAHLVDHDRRGVGQHHRRFHQAMIVARDKFQADRIADIYNQSLPSDAPARERAEVYYTLAPGVPAPGQRTPAQSRQKRMRGAERAPASSAAIESEIEARGSTYGEAATVGGLDIMANRLQRFKEYASPDTFRTIVVVRRLKEGFDHPNITIIGMARKCDSDSEFQQFLGRALRFHRVLGAGSGTESDPIRKAILVTDAYFGLRRKFRDYVESDGEVADAFDAYDNEESE